MHLSNDKITAIFVLTDEFCKEFNKTVSKHTLDIPNIINEQHLSRLTFSGCFLNAITTLKHFICI